jgi:hypothetical protein
MRTAAHRGTAKITSVCWLPSPRPEEKAPAAATGNVGFSKNFRERYSRMAENKLLRVNTSA